MNSACGFPVLRRQIQPPPLVGAFKETFQFPALVVLLSIFITIRFFSFLAAPELTLWKISEKLLGLFLICLMVFYPKKTQESFYHGDFQWLHLTLFILAMLAFVPLYLAQGQSLISSMNYNFDAIFWLFYLFLLRAQIHPRTLIRICVWAGFGWSLVNIIQQFTFPRFIFTSMEGLTPELLIEKSRGGIIRFMIDGVFFAMLAQYYAFNRYLITNKLKYAGYVLFILVGVYCTATRQTLAVSFGVMIFITAGYFLHKRGKLPVKYFFALIVVIAIGYFFSGAVFGKLVEMTKEDATEDNIRVKALNYFFFEHWVHPTAYVFGNGIPKYDSPLGKEMQYLMKVKGLYQSDIGIVGTLSIHGIFYAAAALASVIFGAFRSQGVHKLFVNGTFIGIIAALPLTPYFISGSQAPFFCILYLLADRKALINWDFVKPTVRGEQRNLGNLNTRQLKPTDSYKGSKIPETR
ncbi:MAG: hypothetical protein IPN71_11940 [Fibrobacteres bacterium]|nr:hypothetical protein [Fibrobacterota bacterium]